MPDAILSDGTIIEFKTMSLSNNLSGLRRPLNLPQGKFAVSGSLTAYFENDAVLAAFFGRPHKVTIWQQVRPLLYRTLAYGLLLAATMAFVVTGAL
jgi:hypothetical protein